MDSNILITMKNLARHNIKGHYAETTEILFELLNHLIPDGSTVGTGDSMTLEELGVFDYLRDRKINFLDKHQPSLSGKDKREIYLQNFRADVFVSGANAVTSDGKIINIDGNGSRVAPMIYGPPKVILVVGTNKITKNEAEGMERVRQVSAPLDAKRLGRDTPCVPTGSCTDCNAKDRICNDFVMITRQFDSDRLHVIVVEGKWGY